jgi:hypothetical protein
LVPQRLQLPSRDYPGRIRCTRPSSLPALGLDPGRRYGSISSAGGGLSGPGGSGLQQHLRSPGKGQAGPDQGPDRGGFQRLGMQAGEDPPAGGVRRRWSRAAGTEVTSSAAAPCLDRAVGPHYRFVQHPTGVVRRGLPGAGWIIAFTDDPVTIDDPGRPRSMSAPVVSETRSPFSASRESSACSGDGPSPAAASRAPSSLRSWAVAPL